MSATGAFTFVLHSHMPYARLAGRWPHGEEWIHEAATETYIPLLETLYDLRQEGIPFRLTIGLSPTLIEQLTDRTIIQNLIDYLDMKIAAARHDVQHFKPATIQPINGEDAATDDYGIDDNSNSGDAHLHFLASEHVRYYERVKAAFIDRFDRDIIPAFKQLQDEGYIEIIASAATHPYLPLLARDGTLQAQIRTGIETYVKHFGRRPRGFWLPESAYRPSIQADDGRLRPGLASFLAAESIQFTFCETHTLTGGQPVGVATGDIVGPHGIIKRRYMIPSRQVMPKRQTTTYRPYYIAENGTDGDGVHSGVAVMGRNNTTVQQVWSADWGYPGDFDYREYHKRSGTSGLPYWRVTGAKVDLAHKDFYHPDWASYKIDQHAEHFVHLIGDLLREYHHHTGSYGIITSNYNTELFGHWWFEGIQWLGKVLRHLAKNDDIDLVTAAEFIDEHPPEEVITLPEGSWGTGGTSFTWDNSETNWMWEPIHAAEARMEKLAIEYDAPTPDERTVLNQAGRELLLMQSSDWGFLITTGQAREYAAQRFSQHVERFNRLADSLESGSPDAKFAAEIFALDNIFRDLDYTWFRPPDHSG